MFQNRVLHIHRKKFEKLITEAGVVQSLPMLQSVRKVGEITRQVQTTVWSQPLSYGINKTNRFAQSASAYEFHNGPQKMD